MSRWHSLFLYCESAEDIAQRLRNLLLAQGYTLYDVFGESPTQSYEIVLRAFVTPAQDSWVRVLLEASDPEDLASISLSLAEGMRGFSLALEGVWGGMLVYDDGQVLPVNVERLAPYLKPGQTLMQLEEAVRGETNVSPVPDAPEQIGKLKLPDMPEEMKQMLRKLESGATERMFGKLSDRLLSSDQSESARRLLDKDVPDWNSAAGQHLRAVMACLSVPENWRSPDFTDLRNAYMLLLRRRRRPRAPLYPGDADTMLRATNALDYIPVYGGQNRPASES